jgi:photosystem II stability/assembly factor-like uncharacterized protein
MENKHPCNPSARAGEIFTGSRASAALVMALLLLCSVGGAQAQQEEAIEHAVQAPLAARSLLLDVTAAGKVVVAVGERGHILLSADSGKSWSQADVPTTSNLTSVAFLDELFGVAVGHDAVIVRTRDGGRTWERVYWDPDLETPLLDVWIASGERMLAIGAYGLALESLDGGDSWETVYVSDMDAHLNHIADAPSGALYIAAEAGVAYRSDDEGTTWTELPSPYEGSFFVTVPLAGDSLLLAGLRGHMFRSEDRGESWTTIETGTRAMLTGGLDLGNGRVVVVGLVGTVLVSEDGGRTFALRPRASRHGIQAAAQAPDGALVVVGEFGAARVELSDLALGGVQ